MARWSRKVRQWSCSRPRRATIRARCSPPPSATKPPAATRLRRDSFPERDGCGDLSARTAHLSPLAGRGRRALARRVRGTLQEHGAWRLPLTPTLSPQGGERERTFTGGNDRTLTQQALGQPPDRDEVAAG